MFDERKGILRVLASIHATFALQFMRASLTVPLHFERRQRLDSKYYDMIEDIDKKILRRKCTI